MNIVGRNANGYIQYGKHYKQMKIELTVLFMSIFSEEIIWKRQRAILTSMSKYNVNHNSQGKKLT